VRRPLIAVTIGYSSKNHELFTLRDDYVRAVEKAGGLPVVLAPGRPEDAPDLLARVDGLLLTGGVDVDPGLYGEEPHDTVTRVIPERDAFEIALCREALRKDQALLAICRGQQVLNVATGGTLVQDIPSQVVGAHDHDPEKERWETAHQVRILPRTRLREILERETIEVNSFHHQAVARLGAGLRAVAWSPDGVVEAAEMDESCGFVIAVQWHPEDLVGHDAAARNLFRAVVEESRALR
jgi:putative glutamine amidotransferase